MKNKEVSMGLAEKTCVPCRGGVPPLSREQFEPLLAELEGWSVIEESRLEKSFKFNDFASAMHLANLIAEIAETQGHHPDLLVRWGELKVELWTHKVDGLTESDFILAAKIDRAAQDCR
jgi:4a-hydroxytetrahydrobiopterin dehydratase